MWIASTLRIGLGMLSVLAIWLMPWNESHVAPLAASTFRTESDAALAEWALARFERAELQLPPLSIAFHDVIQDCAGYFGFYRSGPPAHIDICGFTWERVSMAPKKTILHELAHAWTHHNLTEDDRLRFLRFRGLDTWADEATPWQKQGSEHAAEIVAWALIDRDLHLNAIGNAEPETLARAYTLLSGTPPPLWGRTPVSLSGDFAPEDEKLVYWAAGRFREAGLTLPDVDVVIDPTGDACEGASDRFIDNGEEKRVALCTGQKGLTLTNRVVILHELAHSWLTVSVSLHVQTTFLALRRLETWNDRNQPRHLRGVEHAADIIAWALMDQEVWMYRIKPNDFDSLQAGYQLLTGKQPDQRLQEQAAPSSSRSPSESRIGRGVLLKNSPRSWL